MNPLARLHALWRRWLDGRTKYDQMLEELSKERRARMAAEDRLARLQAAVSDAVATLARRQP